MDTIKGFKYPTSWVKDYYYDETTRYISLGKVEDYPQIDKCLVVEQDEIRYLTTNLVGLVPCDIKISDIQRLIDFKRKKLAEVEEPFALLKQTLGL
jgi:hypothetical protein